MWNLDSNRTRPNGEKPLPVFLSIGLGTGVRNGRIEGGSHLDRTNRLEQPHPLSQSSF